ncbi:hypothetical protein KB1253_01380 [Lactiplantibacillus plantarum]|nr:uncharacterized protein SN35N_2740 [Lactiplantibacillus plantarum]GIU64828.1 hypothetical protein LPJCM8341_20140 [Lactiplantibacillus plantarum subsp. plantarum]BEI50514.1 hypothetical protein AWA2013_19200 [Lactiplantibacillus plantarum]GCD84980.1 hypothetical protein KB1253_01380 [Lactiplantibacillus plantarum]GIP77755.1 hypothetical protein ITOLOC_17500 [Lactiplantibacillus plantarum]
MPAMLSAWLRISDQHRFNMIKVVKRHADENPGAFLDAEVKVIHVSMRCLHFIHVAGAFTGLVN